MIKSFKHKGLQDFYEKGNSSGIHAQQMQLVALDTAIVIDDIDLPGFRLHPLKGNLKGLWSIEANKKLAYYLRVQVWRRLCCQLRGLSLMSMHNPPHPGEFIREVYLEPLNVNFRFVAEKLKVSPSRFHRLIKGQSNINSEMALRLSKTLGRTPESWLAMQDNYNLWQAKQRMNLDEVEKLIVA